MIEETALALWTCHKCAQEDEGDIHINTNIDKSCYITATLPTGWEITSKEVLCPDCKEASK